MAFVSNRVPAVICGGDFGNWGVAYYAWGCEFGRRATVVSQLAAEPATTRAEILSLIAAYGPLRASEIADQLDLAAAGIRRHLGALEDAGLIEARDLPATGSGGQRGRGRPARHFVATARAHAVLRSTYTDLAVQVLDFLRDVAGPQAVDQFAARRAEELELRYGAAVTGAGDDVIARARALAQELTKDGYAATLRPGPTGLTLQLCQGHCPVHQVAARFPELCGAETRAISHLLGVHVQRLATLADGEHVCTTCLPVAVEPKSLIGAQ